MKPTFKLFYTVLFTLLATTVQADEWSVHQNRVEKLGRKIAKFEEELETLVDIKKKTRDRSRIEESLQRIVEIHAELISLRRDIDRERTHVTSMHPGKIGLFDSYDSRARKSKNAASRSKGTVLGRSLDQLLIKVQVKFASFMTEEQSEAQALVEKVVEKKEKARRERRADVYLRRRSKVKMSK